MKLAVNKKVYEWKYGNLEKCNYFYFSSTTERIWAEYNTCRKRKHFTPQSQLPPGSDRQKRVGDRFFGNRNVDLINLRIYFRVEGCLCGYFCGIQHPNSNISLFEYWYGSPILWSFGRHFSSRKFAKSCHPHWRQVLVVMDKFARGRPRQSSSKF